MKHKYLAGRVAKEITPLFAVLLAVSLIVSPSALPQPAPKTLTFGMQTDAPSMDPKQFINPQSEWVGATWGETLVWINSSGKLVPWLAASWDILDAKTYVFHLRRGVKFHNGETFNASSLTFSLGRLMAKDSTIQNYGQWISRVDVIDDYTVKLTTPEPDPLFLRRLARVAFMLPPLYGREAGDKGLAVKPVGTGPWKFVEWVRDSRITFEAFQDYWGGRPKIDRIIWKVIPEPEVRAAALRTGEIDIADRLPAQFLDQLQADPSVYIQSVVTPRTFYVAFNVLFNPRANSPIKKRDVRKAINHAVDVDSIIKALLQGQAVRANSLFSRAYVNYDATIPPFKYDPPQAKQLLAEAGYPGGLPLKLDCLKEGWPYDLPTCEAVTAELAKVGIQVELTVYEPGRYWKLEEAHELPGDMFFEGAGDRYRDGEQALQYLYRPDLSVWAYYRPSPEFIAVHNKVRTTLNPEERKQLMSKLTKMMQEDPAALWLWNLKAFQAVRARVVGYTYRADELTYFYGVSLK